jgi:hypothetical protein
MQAIFGDNLHHSKVEASTSKELDKETNKETGREIIEYTVTRDSGGNQEDQKSISFGKIPFDSTNPIVRSFETTSGRGLAGFITNLGFEFENSSWGTTKNPKEGRQVFEQNLRSPKKVKITIGFAPVHDMPLGLDYGGRIFAPTHPVGTYSSEFLNSLSSTPDNTEQAVSTASAESSPSLGSSAAAAINSLDKRFRYESIIGLESAKNSSANSPNKIETNDGSSLESQSTGESSETKTIVARTKKVAGPRRVAKNPRPLSNHHDDEMRKIIDKWNNDEGSVTKDELSKVENYIVKSVGSNTGLPSRLANRAEYPF